MFNNPGAKIKGLAITCFWIEVVALVVAVLAMGEFLFESSLGLLLALVVLAIGVGIAYISALFLAAFGELVETNTQIQRSNEAILRSNEAILAKLNTPVNN